MERLYLKISLNVCSIVSYSVGDSEVDELDLTADYDEVGGLEIGMYNFFLMNNMHGLKHLPMSTCD